MNKYINVEEVGTKTMHGPSISQIFLPSIIKLSGQPEPKINLLEYLICKYCSKILIKYINFSTKTLNVNAYYKDIYSKNTDVYGFIISYLPIILSTIKTKDSDYNKAIIANIIIKYCFSDEYASIPINLNELVNDLTKLNSPTYTIPQINLNKLYHSTKLMKKTKSKKIKSKKTKSKKTKSKKTKPKKTKKTKKTKD